MTINQGQGLNFQIEKIREQKRFIKKDEDSFDDLFCKHSCVFGMSTTVDFEILNHIPKNTKGLYFYYGSAIKDLLEELLKLDITANLEYLTIGITHLNDTKFSDYTEISKILSNTSFPNLKHFEYGIDELLVNEHCIYGKLGDVTAVLKNMPVLEKLYLLGNFEVWESLSFNKLTDLEVLMNDWVTNINGGRISNHTIQNLLSSSFDELKLLSLDLDFNDEIFEYSLPDVFLKGGNRQKLKYLEINGNFVKGTKLAINQSDIKDGTIDRLYLDEMIEPDI